jgi:dTDP-4-amino-4,6-dideoxygalactose transaminase
MMIEKKPVFDRCHPRKFVHFPRARDAFSWFLRKLEARRGEMILLPAYIGWSPREGSGVFDPIREIGLSPVFYHMREDLNIDKVDFIRKLADYPVRFALLIHYFGFVDDHYPELVACLRDKGVVSIEDSAHALLTDLVGLGCGRLGDASIFSLHKILPVETGGLLAIQCNSPVNMVSLDHGVDERTRVNPWEYDLIEISQRRKWNYQYLMDKLEDLEKWIKPLHPILKISEVPQTLPVQIKLGSRDILYHKMNSLGFGVVSLYHSLIEEIDRSVYEQEAALSHSILNLPIHQDVDKNSIDAMVEALCACMKQGMKNGN